MYLLGYVCDNIFFNYCYLIKFYPNVNNWNSSLKWISLQILIIIAHQVLVRVIFEFPQKLLRKIILIKRSRVFILSAATMALLPSKHASATENCRQPCRDWPESKPMQIRSATAEDA